MKRVISTAVSLADLNTCATLDPGAVVGMLKLVEDSLQRIDEAIENTNGSIAGCP